ncbi:hypothetical protein SAMN04489718_0550 [Actinopolyspora saharensis]|uniref:Uncharacterized protein n=1 Tax=Actinopolyspora saharensis TaxID=995062 RepID=A0A1H0YMQ6_9ACTN|nr:hypothetical protein SAMN04489718_0550 [Actinopolyspora saharensis]
MHPGMQHIALELLDDHHRGDQRGDNLLCDQGDQYRDCSRDQRTEGQSLLIAGSPAGELLL